MFLFTIWHLNSSPSFLCPTHAQTFFRGVVYCSSESHRSAQCDTILTFEDRKKFLATKRLCFNCTGPSHRAAECKSVSKCRFCNKRHHTSICDATKADEHEIVKTAHTRGGIMKLFIQW